MAAATNGTLVSRLLANLNSIGFFKRTDDNCVAVADAYLRVSSVGTVCLQNGRPQADWAKTRHALAAIDPEVLGPTGVARHRQYHDVLKNMRTRLPAPPPPPYTRDIFTPEQYTVLHTLMDLKFAELRAHMDRELAARFAVAAPAVAAPPPIGAEDVFPLMDVDDTTGLFADDYNDYTL